MAKYSDNYWNAFDGFQSSKYSKYSDRYVYVEDSPQDRARAKELHEFLAAKMERERVARLEKEKLFKEQAVQKALDSLRGACDTNASIGSADIKALEDAGYQISVSVAMGSEGRMGYQISILPAKAKSNGSETSNW